jgi:hypothetical protein
VVRNVLSAALFTALLVAAAIFLGFLHKPAWFTHVLTFLKLLGLGLAKLVAEIVLEPVGEVIGEIVEALLHRRRRQ